MKGYTDGESLGTSGLREGKPGICLGLPFATLMCKVAYLALKGAQQQL